jgi:hypothetical protein
MLKATNRFVDVILLLKTMRPDFVRKVAKSYISYSVKGDF